MKCEIHQSAQLRYKIDVVRNGKIIPATEWRDNMITDAGLDNVASTYWLTFLSNCILGTNVSPTPVRRDSGAVTLSQSGTTVTASSSFFVAADVGRLIKYGSGSTGSEVYITAFTSATQVTVGTSLTQASTVATIWYVNTAALLTPIAGLTWTKDPGAGNNFNTTGTAGSVATVTCQTVLISSALASPATVTEIAFNNTTTNSNVFDRDLVTPSVGLLAGDQARVTVQLIRNYSPITSVAVGNVGTGLDTSGTMQIECLNMDNNGGGISIFDSNGGVPSNGVNPLDPSGTIRANLISAAITFQAFSFTTKTNRTNTNKFCTNSSYGSGTRFRDSTVTYTISEGNGTITGIGMGDGSINGSNVTFKFTTSATKLSTQTCAISFRKSWSRVLIN